MGVLPLEKLLLSPSVMRCRQNPEALSFDLANG